MIRKTLVLGLSALLLCSGISFAADQDAASTLEKPNYIVSSEKTLNMPLGSLLSDENHTGSIYMDSLFSNDEDENLPEVRTLTFSPKARLNWHVHQVEQKLFVTGGTGYIQFENDQVKRIEEGDVVTIPAGTNHWHGALDNSWMSHIEVMPENVDLSTAWNGALDQEHYMNIEAIDYISDIQIVDHDEKDYFVLPKGDALNLETFNGTNYVAFLGTPTVPSDIPFMMNVIFEPGIYNNWHSHGGGQVMIATDGIGFHQLKGQPIEVLFPGDTAICPPNEEHWHGASAGSWFSHIAFGYDPLERSVNWGQAIGDQVYLDAHKALYNEIIEDTSLTQHSIIGYKKTQK